LGRAFAGKTLPLNVGTYDETDLALTVDVTSIDQREVADKVVRVADDHGEVQGLAITFERWKADALLENHLAGRGVERLRIEEAGDVPARVDREEAVEVGRREGTEKETVGPDREQREGHSGSVSIIEQWPGWLTSRAQEPRRQAALDSSPR
jgi:hypothetical protein